MNVQELACRLWTALQHNFDNLFDSDIDWQVCVLAAHVCLEPLQGVSTTEERMGEGRWKIEKEADLRLVRSQ